jgi:hypothetical protein
MNRLHPRIPAVAVLAGVAGAAVLIVVSSLRYPAIFRLSGAGAVIAFTAVMLSGYAACGAWGLRRPSDGHRTGLLWGAVAGAMWSAEIWCGGPARLPHAAEKALGAAFALLAVIATATAGVRAARAGRAAAWQAGLFSGLISGVVVYAFGVIMTLSALPILGSRGDYLAEFARSQAPNMATFLVGDILAAVAAHLLINLALGLVGGGIGAATVSSAGRETSRTAPRRRRDNRTSRWDLTRVVGCAHAAGARAG